MLLLVHDNMILHVRFERFIEALQTQRPAFSLRNPPMADIEGGTGTGMSSTGRPPSLHKPRQHTTESKNQHAELAADAAVSEKQGWTMSSNFVGVSPFSDLA